MSRSADCKIELPTYANLGVDPSQAQISADEATSIATKWVADLSNGIQNQQLEHLFVDNVLWRDMLRSVYALRQAESA